MTEYNFLEDLFDTYQSLTPFVQVVWALIPPALIASMFAIYLRYRLQRRNIETLPPYWSGLHAPPALPHLPKDQVPEFVRWDERE